MEVGWHFATSFGVEGLNVAFGIFLAVTCVAFDNFSPMNQRMHAVFIGSVQGVGFRFTAERIARESGVCGWVKNLRNGSVEVIAEASKEVLVQYLERLKDKFTGSINSVDVVWGPARGEFRDFTITF